MQVPINHCLYRWHCIGPTGSIDLTVVKFWSWVEGNTSSSGSGHEHLQERFV